MNRFKRIAHRGWLRRWLSVATFGYYPYQETFTADWCITNASTVNDWTLTGTTAHDWTVSGDTTHDWTLAGATVHDWTLTGAASVEFTLTAKVVCCGC